MFNLRGNQRTSGELSRKEGGKIFGSGSRTPVSITILVKQPVSKIPQKVGEPAEPTEGNTRKAVIKYHDIGDYLSREQKLKIIQETESITHLEMIVLHPNEHGDWINQRNESFGKWTPIGDKDNKTNTKTWFMPVYARGIGTSRDAWAYNFDKKEMLRNMKKSNDFFNSELKRYQESDGKISVEDFIDNDERKISWSRAYRNDIKRNAKHVFDEKFAAIGLHRPYCKQNLYFDKAVLNDVGPVMNMFPSSEHENLVICTTSAGDNHFTALISDCIPDLHLTATTQCFPLYYYEEPKSNDLFASKDKYVRKDAVSDYILKQARTQYNDPKIKKEDIFYYVYGFLHSEEYRTEFAADLKKMLPRIPLVDTAENFWAFSKAGRKLAEIHLNYETAEPYKALIVSSNSHSADLPMFSGMAADERAFFSAEPPETLYKVRQMRFAKKQVKAANGKSKTEDDKTRIVYNDKITIANIPLAAYEYVVNGKSAIEWIMERYAVTTDKASGITNDPNDWALEHNDPKYIFNLLLRIITVSLDTMKIVKSLPKSKF